MNIQIKNADDDSEQILAKLGSNANCSEIRCMINNSISLNSQQIISYVVKRFASYFWLHYMFPIFLIDSLSQEYYNGIKKYVYFVFDVIDADQLVSKLKNNLTSTEDSDELYQSYYPNNIIYDTITKHHNYYTQIYTKYNRIPKFNLLDDCTEDFIKTMFLIIKYGNININLRYVLKNIILPYFIVD